MQNTCRKTNRRFRLHAVEQTFKKKDESKYSTMRPRANETLGDSHNWCLLRAGGLSLHMGHCIVMGEALLVVVVPQEAPRIGTYSHFKKQKIFFWQGPRACRTCLDPTSKIAEAADKAEGSCYMPHDVTGLPKKTSSKRQIWSKGNKSGTGGCTSLFFFKRMSSEKQSTEGCC